ncbi:stage II sporulation protein M [Staphylococcus saccharolyticus]|uniref:stage II sporulation protein M n=1 Tax=Staphylococcus saccharolyticus TaxID=33028 RepID=UPI001E449552|nr:stage II sporulation protein M [Staphylococcus saccharolyticus]
MPTSVPRGILFGFILRINLDKGIPIIIASMPHPFIEIFAYCLLASALYKLNPAITRKVSNIFRTNKKSNISFKSTFTNFLKIYIFLALPLCIIAAFLETYV